MMINCYAQGDLSLDFVDVIEDPVSVIWTERWDSYGECRVVVPAEEASKVAVGRVLTLEGRRMACEVVTLLIQDGLATATGRDALAWLDYRIIWGTARRDGYVEGFIRELIAPLEWTQLVPRALPVALGPSAGIPDTASIQRSWRSIGEASLELARQYGFGIMATKDGSHIRIDMAERTDRGLVLSREIGNLSSERIFDDASKWTTDVYVGAGDYRRGGRADYLFYSEDSWIHLQKREAFVDRRDVSPWDPYPDIVAEWGQPTSCGTAYLVAASVADGSGFAIKEVYATVVMTFQNGMEAEATVVSEDFASVLPQTDALVRANYAPTSAGQRRWAMT